MTLIWITVIGYSTTGLKSHNANGINQKSVPRFEIPRKKVRLSNQPFHINARSELRFLIIQVAPAHTVCWIKSGFRIHYLFFEMVEPAPIAVAALEDLGLGFWS